MILAPREMLRAEWRLYSMTSTAPCSPEIDVSTKPVAIVCAGRHGRVSLQVLKQQFPIAGFLDDEKAEGTQIDDVRVLGPVKRIYDAEFVAGYRWFVSIGDNRARQAFTEQLQAAGADLVSAIDARADVSSQAIIGAGVFIAAFVSVRPNATLGLGALIEAGSVIGCDSSVDAFARTGPNVAILGGARLGSLSLAGAGAIVHEDVAVGTNSIVGANSVVLSPVGDDCRVYGAPARPSASAAERMKAGSPLE